MTEKEEKAIEKIDYISDFIIENGQYNADVEDIEIFSTILNLISKLQSEIEAQNMIHKYDTDMIEEVKGEAVRLYKELDLKDKVINKAIGHIEACKTTLGNYILSPNETEYLLEILKGETENDTENK